MLQRPQAEEKGEEEQARTLKQQRTLEDLAKTVDADYSAMSSHQPTHPYLKGLSRCVGVILNFMLTTTVKIATSCF